MRSERGKKLPVRQYDRESTDLIISMLGHSEQLSHVLRRAPRRMEGTRSRLWTLTLWYEIVVGVVTNVEVWTSSWGLGVVRRG